jgi:hypothetical protein
MSEIACARCDRTGVPFPGRAYTGPFVATVREAYDGPVCRPCVLKEAWDAAKGGGVYE